PNWVFPAPMKAPCPLRATPNWSAARTLQGTWCRRAIAPMCRPYSTNIWATTARGTCPCNGHSSPTRRHGSARPVAAPSSRIRAATNMRPPRLMPFLKSSCSAEARASKAPRAAIRSKKQGIMRRWRGATASWPRAARISTARVKAGSTWVRLRRCLQTSNPYGTTGSEVSMNKAFVKESDRDDDDELPDAQILPAGTRNYMTPAGYARLRDELAHLMNVERPAVVQVVSWA